MNEDTAGSITRLTAFMQWIEGARYLIDAINYRRGHYPGFAEHFSRLSGHEGIYIPEWDHLQTGALFDLLMQISSHADEMGKAAQVAWKVKP